MIELNNLSKKFHEKEILTDINLEIKSAEIFGIIGLSGAGKSTLLRIINGLESATQGEVKYPLGTTFGFVFQNFNLVSSLSVFENIKLALINSDLSKEEIEKKVQDALKLVQMSEHKDKYPIKLSGGERQRVGIARALVCDVDVLLCDEATSALDPFTANEIIELLKRLNKQLNLTIVFVSHQLEIVKNFCDTIAILNDGKLAEVGKTIDLFSKPQSRICNQLLSNILGFNEFQGYEYIVAYDTEIQEVLKYLFDTQKEIVGCYQHHTRQGKFAHIFINKNSDVKYQVRSSDGL